ncbi:FAD-dependent oxidoreductase [Pseudomaricurvus alkylphenolicus]|jgi:3-(3-hydroxy-phenyl)propionate hydroxylase|uniref:FAD-dependent oxidoreductase n=1 Tax=Pseudomaricurvus alkylphenolicus TaxID=1306991 RepID=UPI001420FB67|nr:FAD-dependent oxidoreductase [Pseudomaricurvus alkylphenolicus]NIB41000.1 FAD-dependent oxidoreductase [Pseudomaricurvus alkylphenolicus]
MQKTYKNPVYDYVRSPDQDSSGRTHHPVIIVGGGPCGLAAALDFALQGIPTVVLDDNNTVSVGSRAICFAKRTLEIMDRYGAAERMVDKGVTWQLGKVFFQDEQVYEFNLLPEDQHKLPAFINLQQYYFEEYLVDRIAEENSIDLRWLHKVTELETNPEGTHITVETKDGTYQLSCDFLLVADGANSKIRTQLGLESKGQVFQDRFLIADVVMKADFPTERWFWFDPPFHRNQSALLHRQADDVWRIDLQLGWDADPEEEKKEENIRPRLQAMLGEDVEFELEWASVYTFQCRKMDDYIKDRVIFMGDAAHQVSPFGARGANGGVQSVENLAWKVSAILKGEAPLALLETYNTERQHGAAENILNSTRATDFITPKNHISRVFRDETLRLAKDQPFARSLVNSGRLSLPCTYEGSPLNTADSEDFNGGVVPGAVCKDAPIKINGEDAWLMNQLGNRFVAMVDIDANGEVVPNLVTENPDLAWILLSKDANKAQTLARQLSQAAVQAISDPQGLVAQRLALRPGSAYLFRPDQVVCGRWQQPTAADIHAAHRRALGYDL